MNLFKFLRSKIYSLLKIFTEIFLRISFKLRLASFISNTIINLRHRATDNQNYNNIIEKLKLSKKITMLDVGASDFDFKFHFPKKYEKYFEAILVEPHKKSASKLKEKFVVIDKALWSSNCRKTLYIPENKKSASSFYKPSIPGFEIYNPSDNFLLQTKIHEELTDCTTISESLNNLNKKSLDYLKIHAQGSEYEILKGIGSFRPLMIKATIQVTGQYEGVPFWGETLNLLNKLGYMICSWENAGGHSTHSFIQMHITFIPNYLTETGKKIFENKLDQFIFLLLISGQISLLKIISKQNNFSINNYISNLEDKFFY